MRPAGFLRAQEPAHLRLAFCNYASLGQFECARSVAFRLHQLNAACALELLEALARREQPPEWVCSSAVPSSAHLAWLCLTLRHELLNRPNAAGEWQPLSQDKRGRGKGSSQAAPCLLDASSAVGCNIVGLEFDILLVNLLRTARPGLPCISTESLQHLRWIAFVAGAVEVSGSGISTVNELELQPVNAPSLVFFRERSSRPGGPVSNLATVGNLKANEDVLPRLLNAASRRSKSSVGNLHSKEAWRTMQLTTEVVDFLASIVFESNHLALARDFLAEVVRHLAVLNAVGAIVQVLNQCVGVVGVVFGGVGEQRHNRTAPTPFHIQAALDCFRTFVAVHDAAGAANQLTKEPSLWKQDAHVQLLFKAIASLIRARELSELDAPQSKSVDASASLLLANSAFAEIGQLANSSPHQKCLQRLTDNRQFAGGWTAARLRRQIYEALMWSQNWTLLHQFCDEESAAQKRAQSAGMVPVCFGKYRAAQMASQASSTSEGSWRHFWVPLSLLALDVKAHFLEFVVHRALQAICSNDTCTDAGLSAADVILRPFPRLRPLVVSIAYGRVRDNFVRVERLVSTLGMFDGSHRATRRSACLPCFYDFCADLHFKIAFSAWCTHKLNGNLWRNHESETDNSHRRSRSTESALGKEVPTQKAIFEGLGRHSVPFLLRFHIEDGLVPRDDLLLQLEQRPTIGTPTAEFDRRLRDLDVMRYFFVLRAVEAMILRTQHGANALIIDDLERRVQCMVADITSPVDRVHLLENILSLMLALKIDVIASKEANDAAPTHQSRVSNPVGVAAVQQPATFAATWQTMMWLWHFVDRCLTIIQHQAGSFTVSAAYFSFVLRRLENAMKDAKQRLDALALVVQYRSAAQSLHVFNPAITAFFAPPQRMMVWCLRSGKFALAQEIFDRYFLRCRTVSKMTTASSWARILTVCQKYAQLQLDLSAFGNDLETTRTIVDTFQSAVLEVPAIPMPVPSSTEQTARRIHDGCTPAVLWIANVQLLSSLLNASACCSQNLQIAGALWQRCDNIIAELRAIRKQRDDGIGDQLEVRMALDVAPKLIQYLRSLSKGAHALANKQQTLTLHHFLQSIHSRPTEPSMLESHLARTVAENQALEMLHDAQRRLSDDSKDAPSSSGSTQLSSNDFFDEILDSVIETLGADRHRKGTAACSPHVSTFNSRIPLQDATGSAPVMVPVASFRESPTPPYLLHFLRHIAALRSLMVPLTTPSVDDSTNPWVPPDLQLLGLHPRNVVAAFVVHTAQTYQAAATTVENASQILQNPTAGFRQGLTALLQLSRRAGIGLSEVISRIASGRGSWWGSGETSATNGTPARRPIPRILVQWLAAYEEGRFGSEGSLVRVFSNDSQIDVLGKPAVVVSAVQANLFEVQTRDTSKAASVSCPVHLTVPTDLAMGVNTALMEGGRGVFASLLALTSSGSINPCPGGHLVQLDRHLYASGISQLEQLTHCSPCNGWGRTITEAMSAFLSVFFSDEASDSIQGHLSFEVIDKDKSASDNCSTYDGNHVPPPASSWELVEFLLATDPSQSNSIPRTRAGRTLQHLLACFHFDAGTQMNLTGKCCDDFYYELVQAALHCEKHELAHSIALEHLDFSTERNQRLMDCILLKRIYANVNTASDAESKPYRGAVSAQLCLQFFSPRLAARVALDPQIADEWDQDTMCHTLEHCFEVVALAVSAGEVGPVDAVRVQECATLCQKLLDKRTHVLMCIDILKSLHSEQDMRFSHWSQLHRVFFRRSGGGESDFAGAEMLMEKLNRMGLYNHIAGIRSLTGGRPSTSERHQQIQQLLESQSSNQEDVCYGNHVSVLSVLRSLAADEADTVCELVWNTSLSSYNTAATLNMHQLLWVVRFQLCVSNAMPFEQRHKLRCRESMLELALLAELRSLQILPTSQIEHPEAIVQVLALNGHMASVCEHVTKFRTRLRQDLEIGRIAQHTDISMDLGAADNALFCDFSLLLGLSQQVMNLGIGAIQFHDFLMLQRLPGADAMAAALSHLQNCDSKSMFVLSLELLDAQTKIVGYWRVAERALSMADRASLWIWKHMQFDRTTFEYVVSLCRYAELLPALADESGESLPLNTHHDLRKSCNAFVDVAPVFFDLVHLRKRPGNKQIFGSLAVSLAVLADCSTNCDPVAEGRKKSSSLKDGQNGCDKSTWTPQHVLELLTKSNTVGGALVAAKLHKIYPHANKTVRDCQIGFLLIQDGHFLAARDFFSSCTGAMGGEVRYSIASKAVSAVQTFFRNVATPADDVNDLESNRPRSSSEPQPLVFSADAPSIASLESDLVSMSLSILEEFDACVTNFGVDSVSPFPTNRPDHMHTSLGSEAMAECLWYLALFGSPEMKLEFLCRHASLAECVDTCVAWLEAGPKGSPFDVDRVSVVKWFKQLILPRCIERAELPEVLDLLERTAGTPSARLLFTATCDFLSSTIYLAATEHDGQPVANCFENQARVRNQCRSLLSLLLRFQVAARSHFNAALTLQRLYVLERSTSRRRQLLKTAHSEYMKAAAFDEQHHGGHSPRSSSALGSLRRNLDVLKIQVDIENLFFPIDTQCSETVAGSSPTVFREAQQAALGGVPFWLFPIRSNGLPLPWEHETTQQQQCTVLDILWSTGTAASRAQHAEAARSLARKSVKLLGLQARRPHISLT